MKTPTRKAAPTAPPGFNAARPALLQRKCACGGGCAGCRAGSLMRKTYVSAGAGSAVRTAPEDKSLALGPETERRGHSFGRLSVYAPAVLREENLDWQKEPGSFDDTAAAEPLTSDAPGPLTGDAAEPANGAPSQSPVLPGVQTGGTNCDASTGTAVATTTNNDPCTRDCSAQHEAKHVADISPCCAKAGAAHRKAQTQADKDAVQQKFDDWMIANQNFLECRAYEVSITCGQAKQRKLKCAESPYNDKCCAPINRYVTSAMRQKSGTCNNAGPKLTDCPFP